MEILGKTNNFRQNRLGFHYYPDTLHYREYDLQLWLPRLVDLGASWVVLQSEVDRAIPESFIQPFVKAQIEPILQLNLSLVNPPDKDALEPLLSAYGRWGVHAIQLFDRPNSRSSWPASAWAQQNLVERFLDLFLPYAEMVLNNGIVPIFPSLEPGGSYWDTAFLRASLESLERRGRPELIQNMLLSAIGWTGNHPLNWGAGGPERWPNARPYLNNPSEQDQRGFRIFDWYTAIAEAILGRTLPILLFQAGIPNDPTSGFSTDWSPEKHTRTCLAIAHLLASEKAYDPENSEVELETIPTQVAACNFWLLAADGHSPYLNQAWYQDEDQHLPVVEVWRKWILDPHPEKKDPKPKEIPLRKSFLTPQSSANLEHPIKQYLLLPSYDWGVSDWHLDVIRPFVKKYRPTIGFSIEEAALAEQVIVIGTPQTFPETQLESLRQSGCIVERVSGDGTSIATILAER
jgi:hypothetical protein